MPVKKGEGVEAGTRALSDAREEGKRVERESDPSSDAREEGKRS
ncbi:hypothetical protein QNH48_24310 [Neobacillus sp. YX16]|nr:hypothetical protein [Neobacillus sp. YX16]WHZ02066.1 hypothetical protein QNH48_24310 [Neobacillus sp. YX16]